MQEIGTAWQTGSQSFLLQNKKKEGNPKKKKKKKRNHDQLSFVSRAWSVYGRLFLHIHESLKRPKGLKKKGKKEKKKRNPTQSDGIAATEKGIRQVYRSALLVQPFSFGICLSFNFQKSLPRHFPQRRTIREDELSGLALTCHITRKFHCFFASLGNLHNYTCPCPPPPPLPPSKCE